MTEIDWAVLARYLADECTAEEQVRVERWLAGAAAHQATLATLREVAADADRDISVEREAELLALLRRDMTTAAPVRVVRMPSRRQQWPAVFKVAAAVALVLGGSVAAYRVLRMPAARVAVLQPAPHSYATRSGQRASLRLSDGTRVILGVASTLRPSADFDRGAREVVLEGEAYFEVVHDERRPFTVRAGDLVTKDLGTEFTVRAYHEDTHARVVVRQGQVAIQSAASTNVSHRVVEPGQLGRLNAAGELAVEAADTTAYFAWTTGRLVFRGTPLHDAVIQLGRWYGVDVQLASPELGARRLTASFENQPAVDALRWIATVFDLELTQAGGGVYTLRAK